MIKTDSVYIKDLQEIYNLFETGVEVTHAFSVCGKTCTNKYTVGIAEYNYQEPAADGKQIKRFVKSSFYDAMSKYLNQKSAWGAFTGIRPVKYWRELAARGENPREVFLNEFFVSPRKVDLTEEIIKNQILDKDGKDLYVGIPFCPSRCHYCSFISAEIGKSNLAGDYVKTLAAEIKTVKKAHNDFKTVYIGGGTPVCLDIRDLETILKTVGKGNGKEYTVEAGRCDELTREKTELLKKYGVTRVCLNPQSFNQNTLDLIGRKTEINDFYDKYRMLKEFDFIINFDLILGFENESQADFLFSVNEAVRLRPHNITIHTLCLKSGAKLKEKITRLKFENAENAMDKAYEILRFAGYKPYYLYKQKYACNNLENTGFALDGCNCEFNIVSIEDSRSVIAAGAGGITKIITGNRIDRYENPKDILTYIGKSK